MKARGFKKRLHQFSMGTLVLGGLTMYFVHLHAAATGCGLPPAGVISGQIAHAPTISAQTILWAFGQRGSPAALQTPTVANWIVQLASGQASGHQPDQIDDAFALAIWAEETQDGREAVPGTRNIGNVTAPTGVHFAGHIFAIYPTWEDGIAAWFDLIDRLYLRGGHATDFLTFALFYVLGLTPQEATTQQKAEIAQGYVHTVSTIMTQLQQHEAGLHPGGSGPGTSGGGTSPAGSGQQTLANLLPSSMPPGWAGPGVGPAAASILLTACQSQGSAGPHPLVLAALQLAVHLEIGVKGLFNRWGPGTPAGVRSQGGVTQCTDFVASAYERATHKPFPAFPDAGLWWDGSVGHAPGFVQVLARPGSFPQAGDIIVLRDGGAGHVALALGVQVPQNNQPGFVIVGQANTTHVLERWTLFPNGALTTPWNYATTVLGYIRIPGLAHSIASRVQPIIQAENNGQYDSPAQHDTWWDSVCSAASFTEVARAWGIANARIGLVLDRLLAHSPPYITVAGGLMSPDGWPWMAAGFHLTAKVAWHAYTFDSLVQQVNTTGIPVIIGLQAATWSHYVVVVGGDKTHAVIVDSSTWRMHTLPPSFFSGPTSGIINVPIWWTGETVILTPA